MAIEQLPHPEPTPLHHGAAIAATAVVGLVVWAVLVTWLVMSLLRWLS